MDDHSEITVEGPDVPVQPVSSYRQRRILVLALICSFLACLAAFSLVIDLFHLLNQISPSWIWIFQFIADHRIALIIAPLLGLIASAIALCYITRDIMSGPARYLDERQKIVRDQAHSSAYTIMKFVVIAGILGFVLLKTFLPVQNSPVASIDKKMLSVGKFAGITKPDTNSPIPESVLQSAKMMKGTVIGWRYDLIKPKVPIVHPVQVSSSLSSLSSMQWPTDSASIIFFYSTLLLCLFIMITALPKAVAAWRKQI